MTGIWYGRLVTFRERAERDMAPRFSLPAASKKRKHAEDNNESLSIQTLEKQLIAAVSSKSSLNPIADLLDIAYNATDPQVLSKAIWSLYRVLVVVITNGALLNVAGNDESKAVRAWLQEKLNGYVKLLASLLKDEESVLKVRKSWNDTGLINFLILCLTRYPP